MGGTLVTWIGGADLRSLEEGRATGPISQATRDLEFDRVILLGGYEPSDCQRYSELLKQEFSGEVELHECPVDDPTAYEKILDRADGVVKDLLNQRGDTGLSFHLTPGTPTMHAVWLLLGKARYPADLIQTAPGGMTEILDLPFEMSVDLRPEILRSSARDIERMLDSIPQHVLEFDSIIHECDAMKRVVARARMVSQTDFPVLIYGESGTGKELFANSIHKASSRGKNTLVPINCAAIPAELVESTLFGVEKGAFTGAVASEGSFRAANRSTLFLDEIGELSLPAQAKLLRVLQEKEVLKVGGRTPTEVDVRIIAATHQNLGQLVLDGRFREDLLMRIEVAVLEVPPLRERGDDIAILVRHLWNHVQSELGSNANYRRKELSPAAKNRLKAHRWPGNIRELDSVLKRAGLWAIGDRIEGQDVADAIIRREPRVREEILHRPLDEGIDLESLLEEVKNHYLYRALEFTEGNKAEASRVLGLRNPDQLRRWLNKAEVSENGGSRGL